MVEKRKNRESERVQISGVCLLKEWEVGGLCGRESKKGSSSNETEV